MHFVERTAFEVVGVDVVEACAAPVSWGWAVISGRCFGSEEVGDLLDAVRNARKVTKESGKLAIHAFENVADFFEELLGGLGIKTGVSAQELEKIRKASFEFGLLDDGLHLFLDASDLGQADLMDLLGSKRQRCKSFDAMLVEAFSLG